MTIKFLYYSIMAIGVLPVQFMEADPLMPSVASTTSGTGAKGKKAMHPITMKASIGEARLLLPTNDV